MNTFLDETNSRKTVPSVVSIGLMSLIVFASACTSKPEKREPASEVAHPNAAGQTNGQTEGHAPWNYHGEKGPTKWGELKSEFETCKNGKAQSPIDLKWKKPRADRAIKFNYTASPLKIIDNGHTIQTNFEPGSHVDIGGARYELLQVHFHAQSEHTLSGKHYPLEAHLVHKNAKGELAVVGVFFIEGKRNATLDMLWGHMPTEKNKEFVHADVKINPLQMIPPITTHYHYTGSLTTPPCSEGVNWNVLNTPLTVSREQIEAFRKLYADNFRPVQPVFERKPANY